MIPMRLESASSTLVLSDRKHPTDRRTSWRNTHEAVQARRRLDCRQFRARISKAFIATKTPDHNLEHFVRFHVFGANCT